jgi:Flp pilus assembly protein protease CpaA
MADGNNANSDEPIDIMDSAIKPGAPVTDTPTGFGPTTAIVAAGSVATTAAFVGLTRLVSGIGDVWVGAAFSAGFYALVFVALLLFMERYSGYAWTVPAGSENSNWALRNRVSFVLGMLVVVAASASASLRIADPLERGLTCLTAVIMAVAGANDIKRFRLPLPLTIVGLMVAVVLFMVGPFDLPFLLLAFGWAAMLIVIHTFIARSGMALGDMIALFWIALASPFNGLLAVFVSQLVMDALARITTWKADKKRIPIGGAWLVATAAAIALPHWPVLISAATANAPLGIARAPVQDNGALMQAAFEAGEYGEAGLDDLNYILRDAGYLTARISMYDKREQRVAAAVAAARKVAEMRIHVLQTEVPKTVKLPAAEVLSDLSTALAAYDTDGVRAAASRLAVQREQVAEIRDAYISWKESAAVASSNKAGDGKP